MVGMKGAGMRLATAVISGAVGASALTGVHEIVRRVLPEAPRVDIVGMRAIAAGLRGVNQPPPPSDELFNWALVGDMLSNSAYYSLAAIGRPEGAVRRGLLLGLGAGVAAVALPPILGLGARPTGRTPLTQALTVAWYTLGGIAAGTTARQLSARERPAEHMLLTR